MKPVKTDSSLSELVWSGLIWSGRFEPVKTGSGLSKLVRAGLVWIELDKTGLWPGFSWSGPVWSSLLQLQLFWAVLVRFDPVSYGQNRFQPVNTGLSRAGVV